MKGFSFSFVYFDTWIMDIKKLLLPMYESNVNQTIKQCEKISK